MRNYLIIAVISMLFLGACSSITVTSNYDKTIDFTKYKTFSFYGWAKESNKILTPWDQRTIENAFGEEFEKRGLKYVEEGGDLTVALYIQTQKKQETTATTTGMGGFGYGFGGYYGWGPGWGWGPGFVGGTSYTTYQTYDYEVGTLVVDVFDAKKKELIWESAGEGTIDEKTNNREARIEKAVAQIMATYPVQPPKSK